MVMDMLRRFIFQEKVLLLSMEEGAYYINFQGVVTFHGKTGTKIIVCSFKNGEYFLDLDLGHGEIRLATLMNFAFKGNFDFAREELLKRKVKYIDGNPRNISPDNLIWSTDGLVDDEDGFRVIPGYSRYKINREGLVVNYVRGTIQQSYTDKYGYIFFGMTPDVGKRLPVGLHRLMALTFLDIPINFHKLDVNHIDGIKSNNAIDNLEWCTRLENNLHAVKIGLRNDNRIVLVRDIRTNEVTEYFSMREAARVLKLGKCVVDSRVKSKGRKIYEDRKQYCLKSDFTEWGAVSEEDLFNSRGVKKKVKYTNSKSGEELIFEDFDTAANYLNLNIGTLRYRLRGKTRTWSNGEETLEKII